MLLACALSTSQRPPLARQARSACMQGRMLGSGMAALSAVRCDFAALLVAFRAGPSCDGSFVVCCVRGAVSLEGSTSWLALAVPVQLVLTIDMRMRTNMQHK